MAVSRSQIDRGGTRVTVQLPLAYAPDSESVTDASDGFDGVGAERDIDLAAHVADVHLDDVVGSAVVRVPFCSISVFVTTVSL